MKALQVALANLRDATKPIDAADRVILLDHIDQLRNEKFAAIHTNGGRNFTMNDRHFSYEGNGFILDNNFDFDAGFSVSGDFVDDDKDNYCRMLVEALNRKP